MIDSIQFILYTNYPNPLTVSATYTKIFNFEYPEMATVHDSGFFAQSASQCSFTLNYDSWINTNIIDPANDVTEKYAKYIVRLTEGIDGDDDPIPIWDGIIDLNSITYDEDKEKINFVCYDFLALISDVADQSFSIENTGSFFNEVIKRNEYCLYYLINKACRSYWSYESAYGLTKSSVKPITGSYYLGFTPESEGCFLTVLTDSSFTNIPTFGSSTIINIWDYFNWDYATEFTQIKEWICIVSWAKSNSAEKTYLNIQPFSRGALDNSYYRTKTNLSVAGIDIILKPLCPDQNLDNVRQKYILCPDAMIGDGSIHYAFIDSNKNIYFDVLKNDVGNSYDLQITSTMDYETIDAAYTNAYQLNYSKQITITRREYTGRTEFYYPVGEDDINIVNISSELDKQTFYKTFYLPNSNLIAFDIRCFVNALGGEASGVDSYFKNLYYVWRGRYVLIVSGTSIVASYFETAIEESTTIYSSTLFTEEFNYKTDTIDWVAQPEFYDDTEVGQRYYGSAGFLNEKRVTANDYEISAYYYAILTGYIFNDYISWKYENEISYSTLLSGISLFNNLTYRASFNNLYLESRTNLATTSVTIADADLIELNRGRILQDAPDPSFLDYVNDGDRVNDLMKSYYDYYFENIRQQVTYEVSSIFVEYLLDINYLTPIDGFDFKVVSIKKIEDGIYQIKGYENPLFDMQVKFATDSVLYSLLVEGELDATESNLTLRSI
jgi:hypothetical protein